MYPYEVVRPAAHKREFPADLAHAGEPRQFIAWTGAVAGLRGGSLSDLAVAAEAGPDKVRVNCIMPGPFLTDMPLKILSAAEKEEFARRTLDTLNGASLALMTSVAMMTRM